MNILPARFRRLRSIAAESLRARIFIVFVLYIVLSSSAFTLLSGYSQSRQVEERLSKKGELLAQLLSSSTRTGVFAEDRGSLRNSAAGVMAQSDVISIAIYTADDRLLFIEGKPHQPAEWPATSDRPAVTGRTLEGKLMETVLHRDRISFFAPVTISQPSSYTEALYFDVAETDMTQSMIGYVRVTMDRSLVLKEVRRIFIRNLLLALVFVVSGSVTIYLILRRITKPLIMLTQRVKYFGEGISVEKIPVEAKDEIGNLAEAFNSMIDDLRRREHEKEGMEDKLRHAEKMEAVGGLARGIAHDFNNILATIEGSLFILKKMLAESSQLVQYTEQIHKSVSKMKGLVQGLLAFSKTQVANLMPVDLNGVIMRLIPMLKDLAGSAVQLEFSFGEETCVVLADALQIDQILMNLCTNARDALPAGGVVTIRTETVSYSQEYSVSHSLIRPGRYGMLSVEDTGTGMDEMTSRRIFEPFFTTKEPGKGTGLGLATVFGIVQWHNGAIDVRSAAGKGTEFRIYLPLHQNVVESGDLGVMT